MNRGVLWSVLLGLVITTSASAITFQSPNLQIDGSIGDSIAGRQTSTNYQMVATGGESIAGDSSSASYKLGQGYTSQLEKSIQLTTQSSGLGAYYAFESTGNKVTYDETSNNRHGALLGNSVSLSQPGKVGNSLTLGGSTPADSVNTQSNMGFSTFTTSGWVYPTVNGGAQTFVSNTRDCCGSPYYGYEISTSYASNNIRFKLWGDDGSSSQTAGGANVDLNQWNFITASYDGSTMRVYKNGALVGSSSFTATSHVSPSSQMYIGRMGTSNSNFFNGKIDEVKFYSRVLSNDEILAEYNAGVAGNPAGISVGNVTPGISKTSNFNTVVLTDAPGYSLFINQDNNLTSGGSTIPAVSGSIASPVSWNEGSTKGLGFTVAGASAAAPSGTWSSGNSYAALPSSSTAFYSRSGYSGGSKDTINLRLRLDTATSQAQGAYSNQMTITGTMTP